MKEIHMKHFTEEVWVQPFPNMKAELFMKGQSKLEWNAYSLKRISVLTNSNHNYKIVKNKAQCSGQNFIN